MWTTKRLRMRLKRDGHDPAYLEGLAYDLAGAEEKAPGKGNKMTIKVPENCDDESGLLETRNESLMKQAARLLAAAGGYRFRHYLVKVVNGHAVEIMEYDPPRICRTLL